MITSESETPIEKVGVAQYGNVQWLPKGEMAPTLFSLVFRPGLMESGLASDLLDG